MSEWKPKRFWTASAVVATDGGFTVELDGRRVRTPAKAALVLPTRAMAEAVAREWDAQEKEIDPATMPFTRSANAAIDKVQHQHAEVADMLSDYGDSDLLCYRATHPEALIERQRREWDPALDWAAETLGRQTDPGRRRPASASGPRGAGSAASAGSRPGRVPSGGVSRPCESVGFVDSGFCRCPKLAQPGRDMAHFSAG